MGEWTRFICLKIGTGGGGSCECDNELPGSIKCQKFLDELRICLLLKKNFAQWS
jgi:hypothetical protein